MSRQILRYPGFLWKNNLTAGTPYLVSSQTSTFNYPPLLHLNYAFLFLLDLSPKILDILSILLIGYFLYKMEKKAIPLMFLSFLFVRLSFLGGIDIFLLALVVISIYFFEKKPEISGIFAGLTLLVKGTSFLFFGGWLLSILIFKRKEIFNKRFYKNKFFIAIILSFVVFSTWYLRNFILFNGDILATLFGFKSSDVSRLESWLGTGIQQNQPEKYWFDTTGFYPLPIDLLFYIGIIFTIFSFYKTRKFGKEHLLILIFVAAYIVSQAISFNFIMTIRYYLPIFPLLAIQIIRGFPEKYLKFLYLFCIIILIFWIYNLPKYSFNQFDLMIGPICEEVKNKIDFEPVFVKAFHDWFVIYKCDLNATTELDSKWILNLDQGQLYLTNKTNLTGS
jgi:hypothetical protein